MAFSAPLSFPILSFAAFPRPILPVFLFSSPFYAKQEPAHTPSIGPHDTCQTMPVVDGWNSRIAFWRYCLKHMVDPVRISQWMSDTAHYVSVINAMSSCNTINYTSTKTHKEISHVLGTERWIIKVIVGEFRRNCWRLWREVRFLMTCFVDTRLKFNKPCYIHGHSTA